MVSHSTPSKLIKIDKHTDRIELPTILLEKRNGDVIGKISNYTNYNLSLVASGIDEVSFEVHKYVDGKKCNIWDDLIGLKIIELKGYGRFQINVGYTDDTQTVKSVIGQSLEVELAELPLREFHINDEEDMDIEKTDYSEHKYDENDNFIPVYFYNKDNPKRSLLHMVLADKAPHWKIGHVPTYVTISEDDEAELSSKFMRTYTEDGTSIYDFLTSTVAKETNVVFIFNTTQRIIDCYNLEDCYITKDGQRVLTDTNDADKIGEDTLIYATKRNIVNQITIDSNEDQVKNCLFIESGDDVINGMVAAVNMNGTRYIWKFAPHQLNDMSDELKSKIEEYQTVMSNQETKDEYYGENGIYTRLCLAYEDLYLKESTMSPNLVNVDVGTAKEQYDYVVETFKSSTVYVSSINDYNSQYYSGVSNNVEAYASILTDSRYEVKVVSDTASYDDSTHIWTGKIKITQNTNDTNTYPIDIDNSEYISVTIGDGSTINGQIEYTKQKLLKSLAKSDMQNLDFSIEDDKDKIKEYFDQFSLNRLNSFYDAYNGCVSILSEYGTNTSSEIQQELYYEYKKVLDAISEIREVRQSEVNAINDLITRIKDEQLQFQSDHDFYTFLGEELYTEFCSYRREDTYSNPNYISDNCNTVAEQLEKAKELMDVADTELGKACMLQRTVSTSLSNLLVLPEFEKLYDSFALFNYIRIETDDEVLKLRLIGIEFNGDSIQDINVTFSEQVECIDKKVSDIESILNQAQSISGQFPATVRQAKQGESANKEFIDVYANGLNATKAMITNNDNNEVTITNAGLLAKRMDDEGYYGDKQLRIVGNGMYLTDDAWKSLKMAVGEIVYTNPITSETEKAYGLIADTLIGNLIAGKQMHIGNEDGSVLITGNGIEITNGTIQSHNYEVGKFGSKLNLGDGTFDFAGGNLTYDEENGLQINGNGTFSGTIYATDGEFNGILNVNECTDMNSNPSYSFSVDNNGVVYSRSQDSELSIISGKIQSVTNSRYYAGYYAGFDEGEDVGYGHVELSVNSLEAICHSAQGINSDGGFHYTQYGYKLSNEGVYCNNYGAICELDAFDCKCDGSGYSFSDIYNKYSTLNTTVTNVQSTANTAKTTALQAQSTADAATSMAQANASNIDSLSLQIIENQRVIQTQIDDIYRQLAQLG